MTKSLGDLPVRVLQPTELLALKIHAAVERRGCEKGAKDLADILALLHLEKRNITWNRVKERLP